MLLNNFFTIINKKVTNTELPADIIYTIKTNPLHPVFQGHFPGTPVVPGVCLIQIVKECLENFIMRDTVLSSSASVKFLQVLQPSDSNEISVQLDIKNETGTFKVKAVIFKADNIYLKLDGTFNPQN